MEWGRRHGTDRDRPFICTPCWYSLADGSSDIQARDHDWPSTIGCWRRRLLIFILKMPICWSYVKLLQYSTRSFSCFPLESSVPCIFSSLPWMYVYIKLYDIWCEKTQDYLIVPSFSFSEFSSSVYWVPGFLSLFVGFFYTIKSSSIIGSWETNKIRFHPTSCYLSLEIFPLLTCGKFCIGVVFVWAQFHRNSM